MFDFHCLYSCNRFMEGNLFSSIPCRTNILNVKCLKVLIYMVWLQIRQTYINNKSHTLWTLIHNQANTNRLVSYKKSSYNKIYNYLKEKTQRHNLNYITQNEHKNFHRNRLDYRFLAWTLHIFDCLQTYSVCGEISTQTKTTKFQVPGLGLYHVWMSLILLRFDSSYLQG